MKHVAILGCVGIPANYGGYETLAQNLVEGKQREDIQYVVYCSSKAYSVKMKNTTAHGWFIARSRRMGGKAQVTMH